ncbi:MAG TPA: tripartite tricarboxylate transporter substrate-binding protein [Alphaproteobacteria bacterium]|nr:tripartite tricarboxylate transporter substrate-binding protein [Alphaproteobacteria bacterium]
MTKIRLVSTRRSLLKGAAAIAAGTAAPAILSRLGHAAYPERNIKVVIPTAQGGGADRLARAFSDAWRKALGAAFEFEFFPGGAGQVGYEIFTGRRDKDAYNLLFGNMGPEMIMYVLQSPKYKFPDDYFYFCRIDVDDSSLYVRAESPFKRIEDVVAEAKRRVVTVATSRLPHPASIGVLALGDATGAKFNLVPYGGGNPTMVATLNGEVDCGVLPVAEPIKIGEKVRVLGVFNDVNLLAAKTGDAPPVNKVFGTKIPDLYSSRAWAVHTEAADKFPDRFKLLNESAQAVFKDPAFKEIYEKTAGSWQQVSYGGRDVCTKYAQGMVELANRYKPLLTAKK